MHKISKVQDWIEKHIERRISRGRQWREELCATPESLLYFGSDRISAFRDDSEVNFVYAHTSGHTPVADLQRLAAALNLRKLVPIHTEHGEDFPISLQT